MEVVGTIAILYLTSTYKKQDLLTLTIYWGGHSALIALFGTPGGGDSGGNIIKQLLSNKRKSQLMKALTVDESHN